MTTRTLTMLVAAFLAASPSWLGCDGSASGEEDAGGTPEATGEALAEETVADSGTPSGACADLPDLTGRAYRVVTMLATEPTDQMNEVWQTDIATYDLVMAFYVSKHDVEGGTATIQVTSCKVEVQKNADGTYTPLKYNFALEPSEFQAVIKGCNFAWKEPIDLDIQTPTVSKPFHLFGIVGNGKFNEDGTKILDCKLEGGISEKESVDLCLVIPGLGVANFHWFMNLAHICPLYDSDGDGKADSYRFKGKVDAVDETSLFSPEVKPITPEVTDCPVDDKKCVP